MWTAPLLLCLVGSASLWVPAQAAVFASLEENLVTSAAAVGTGSPGKEDLIPTTSGSEAPQPSPSLTTRAPAGAESTAGPGVEDMSTLASSTHSHQKSQRTTAPPMATETSAVNVTEPIQTTVHKDGLSTVSLAGIVIGLLITIVFLGGVIFLFVRKMSS